MQSRAWVACARYARGARSAPLTTPVGVLLETTLQEHGGRCALSYIRERAARARAFGCHCSRVRLSLYLRRLSVSLSASSPSLSASSLSTSLSASSLRLSLRLLSLSLCVSLFVFSLYVAFSLRLLRQNISSRPPSLLPSLRSPQLVAASAS